MQGTFQRKFITETPTSEQPRYPADIAVGENGDIYVIQFGGVGVAVFNADGTFKREFGTTGTEPGQFQTWPVAINLDKDENIYVVESGRVQVFTNDGTFIRQFGNTGTEGKLSFAGGLFVADNGDVFVTDRNAKKILLYDAAGTFKRYITNASSGPGSYFGGTDLIVQGETIYALDSDNGRIQLEPVKQGIYVNNFYDREIKCTPDFELKAAPSSGEGALSFSIVDDPANTAVVTLSGEGNKIMNVEKLGTIKLQVYVSPTENFGWAYKTCTLTLTKGDQTISVEAVGEKLNSAAPFDIVAASNAKLPLKLEIVEGSDIATLENTTVTLTKKTGLVNIKATQEGNEVYNAATANVVFKVVIDPILATDGLSFSGVSIAPNPAKNWIAITSENERIQTVVLTDMMGNVSYKADEVNANEHTVSTTAFASGMYLLSLLNVNGKNACHRVVIMK
jgi:hypothetical protein